MTSKAEYTNIDVLMQLDAVLKSSGFCKSPRASKFLKYIVENALDGETAKLKGYAIGIDVFGRSENFDPQQDSIVRVQAGRLRRMLADYYLKNAADTLVIQLPKGAYIPEIKRVELGLQKKNGEPEDDVTNVANVPSRKSYMWPVISAGLILLMVFAVGVRRQKTTSFDTLMQMPLGPKVVVEVFENLTLDEGKGGQETGRLIALGVKNEIVNKLSRFKNIHVLEIESARLNGESNGSTGYDYDFTLSGSVNYIDKRILLTSRLIRHENGEVLWSKIYDESITDAHTLLEIKSDISSEVAAVIGQQNGVASQNFIPPQSQSNAKFHIEDYLCVQAFNGVARFDDVTEFYKVKACLKKAVANTPNYSLAWGALSHMYAHEAHLVNNTDEGMRALELQAVGAAQKGVAADTDNAIAYQYLALAMFYAGDSEGFRHPALMALQLNPNDPDILAGIGRLYIIGDGEDSERGKRMVEKAIKVNPAHPDWYHFPLAIYYYAHSENEIALMHARQFSSYKNATSQMLLAVTLVENDDIKEAQRVYKDLIENYPHFVRNFDEMFGYGKLPKSLSGKILTDLIQAGLVQ